ncbi:MAG: hypothetical protein WCV71_04350 [Patescibacteria group bacterium]|jgi:hypothetical protein
MNLSELQKYILKTTLQNNKAKLSRNIFEKFYDNKKNPPSTKIRANIITKSIERLIDKGLLTGFGEKTQYKLFITQIKLTARGKKAAQNLFGQQVSLPLRIKK